MPDDSIDQLRRVCSREWSAIRSARQRTDEKVAQIINAISELDAPGTSVVVTGSVGRGELTSGSDFDWMLLVDGESNPDHFVLAQAVKKVVDGYYPKGPGPTAVFGGLVSSHDLVHHIAGTRDTNENLTRRILLLLESKALTGSPLRERVIRNILVRYVVRDRPVPSRSGNRNFIPHFLLNDVVRYWRTMASDFASKMWERNNQGWAIRNTKLRFSRKLLFVAGLLTCFSAEMETPNHLSSEDDESRFLVLLSDFICDQTSVSPLNKLASKVLPYPACGEKLFDAYDAFVAALNDESLRSRFETVTFEAAPADDTYNRLREHSHSFRNGIEELFFDHDPRLSRLIRRLGVF
ncbi:MAG TPA: nucleotidyltransferase domain-containing protein [Candidatus Binatia bacterium]|jgi:hypothetical protein|nr:nucleotidyltransferase domain-containing protein [Candidatus Binatia bacterium]